MKCARCKWKYPFALLSRMFLNGGYTEEICGICALELSNEASGVKRKEFTGLGAESYRKSAIYWRKTHPNDAPN